MSLSVSTARALASFGFLLVVAGATTGCVDRHTVRDARAKNPKARVDIGPIVSDRGVDLGPVVAARMRERRLADARYVAAPTGATPYVTGRVRTERGDAGWSGASRASMWLIPIGGIALVPGTVMLVAGSNSSDQGASTVANIGGVAVGLGVAALAGGLLLLSQPSRYREASLVADLQVRRGPSATAIKARDETTVYHDLYVEDAAGGPLLDGVVNTIGKHTAR